MDMEIIKIVKEEFHKRMIEEGQARIEKCLAKLSDEELWRKPNKNSNSMGNLVLHLSGNVRQYIISGVGGEKDTRERDLEFDPSNIIPREELLEKLDQTLKEANSKIDDLNESDLSKPREAQGMSHSCLSIIIHVIEHFSYHVGQITYYTKFLKDMDMAYYEGMDLNKKSN